MEKNQIRRLPRRPARRIFAAILAACALAGAGDAHALPKALFCYADGQGPNISAQLSPLINAGGMFFEKIDQVDCRIQTPTVNTLKMYDVVYVWNGATSFQDPNALGNNLADYSDAGGGVVQGMYNFYNLIPLDIRGRWASDKYNCINPSATGGVQSLKPQATDPQSPFAKGVMTFSANVTGNGGLAQGATAVWEFANNQPAIATCKKGLGVRVDLNFYPNPASWKGDGAVILQNALIGAGGGLSPLRGQPNPVAMPDTGTGATSSPATVTYTNISMLPQTATGLALVGTNPTDFGIVKQPSFPVTLNPNQSFTVDVNFSPLTQGARTAKLSVAIQGMNIAPAEVNLNGKGIGAKLVVSPNPVDVGGTQIGMTRNIKVNVANTGGGRINIGNITLGNPAFVIAAGPDLPLVISSGGSFDMTIAFTPAQNGIAKDTMVITTNDPNAPTLSIPVSGYAGPPALGTDAGSVAFGSVNVGAKSNEQPVEVQNIGFSDLTIIDVRLAGQNVGDFMLDKKMLPGVIGAQKGSPVGLVFAPSAPGTRIAQLIITSNDQMNPTKTVNLFGTGTQTALKVSTNALDFGTTRVGMQSMNGDVDITAMGNGTLRVLAIDVTGPNATSFVRSGGPLPPFSVAGNATQEKISFACKPNTIGALAASANVVTDVGSAMIAFKCTGTSPKVSVVPNQIDFGTVAVEQNSEKIPVKIENLGSSDLSITNLLITGSDSSDFNSTDMPQMLPAIIRPGASLSFTVVFSPTEARQETAEIAFDTDDPLLPSGRIPMVGVGAKAGLSIVPGMLDFGTVVIGGTSMTSAVTVTNSGAIPLSLTSLGVSGPGSNAFVLDRTIDRQNPFVLAPRQSLVVNVYFKPISQGAVSGTFQVIASGLGVPVGIAMRGQGYAAMLRVGLPGNAPDLDLGEVTVGKMSDPGEVRLRNDSSGPLTLGAITVDNPAFKIDTSKASMTLAPMGMTSLFVTFNPSVAGGATGTVSIKLKDGVSAAATAKVRGQGIAGVEMPPPGGCAVSGRAASGEGMTFLILLAVAAGGLSRRRRRESAGRLGR